MSPSPAQPSPAYLLLLVLHEFSKFSEMVQQFLPGLALTAGHEDHAGPPVQPAGSRAAQQSPRHSPTSRFPPPASPASSKSSAAASSQFAAPPPGGLAGRKNSDPRCLDLQTVDFLLDRLQLRSSLVLLSEQLHLSVQQIFLNLKKKLMITPSAPSDSTSVLLRFFSPAMEIIFFISSFVFSIEMESSLRRRMTLAFSSCFIVDFPVSIFDMRDFCCSMRPSSRSFKKMSFNLE